MKENRGKTRILKSVCLVILSLLIVITGLFTAYVVNAKSEIIPNNDKGIPDKYLYQAILYSLEKKSDSKFTKDEAEGLYALDQTVFFGKKIKTLKGIEKLTNLHHLSIGDNKLTNLNGIEKLINLSSLKIGGNKLTNLKGVESLTNLESLSVGKGKLKNVNEIKNLSKLKELSVNGNKLEDWTIVSDLTNLENLYINGCGLTDSSLEKIVGKLTKLTGLGIADNSLNNLKLISGLTKLESLGANNCKLKSLSGIENLTKLQSLSVSNNRLTNLNGIENLTKLQFLYADKNKITNLPSLKKLKIFNLEYSTFDNNKISEKVFKKNLPSHVPKWWINNQVMLQNFKKKLKVNKVKKIKSTTKKITGVTEKRATVVLMTSKGKKIKKVKVNKKGAFCFKKLDLRKYKGKKLKITAYLLYDDQINGERNNMAVKTVKFTVRK